VNTAGGTSSRNDAFNDTPRDAYRLKARTLIATLGYNRAFGERHALDVSWRRAQSSVQNAVDPASGSDLRYTVNSTRWRTWCASREMAMNGKILLRCTAALVLALLPRRLHAEKHGRRGGRGHRRADRLTRFLLFPNPIAQNTGGFETDTNRLRRCVLPRPSIPSGESQGHARKMEGQPTDSAAEPAPSTWSSSAIPRTSDYGRRMTGRMSADGSVAFFVENYSGPAQWERRLFQHSQTSRPRSCARSSGT